MGVARAFRSLELYDILANLVPGSVLVIFIGVVFGIETYIPLPTGAVTLGVFLIIALTSGHIIQFVASRLEGTPTLFGTVVRASKREDIDDVPIPITHIEEAFWPLMEQKFALPEDFDDYGEMLRLLMSYVETTPATRALRFQALHSFHRSMWAVWYLGAGLAIVGTALKLFDFIIVRSWPVLGISLIGALAGIRIFRIRKEKFNRLFIQYAIVDFYTDQVEEQERTLYWAK